MAALCVKFFDSTAMNLYRTFEKLAIKLYKEK